MSQTNDTSPGTSLLQVVFSFAFLLAFAAGVFSLAGDWRWTEGWIFSIVFFALGLATVVYLYFEDPALLDERFGSPVQKEQKAWDKVLLSGFLLGFVAWYVVMPLDARRFGWSPEFPLWLEAVGAVLYVLNFVVMFGAFRENTFAAPVVKIQKERRQKVVSSGPYGFVRHPMYLGGTLLVVGAPLLLGSLYGLGVGILLALLLAVRSIGEERMLERELDGYAEYMEKVRWRLIPFVF